MTALRAILNETSASSSSPATGAHARHPNGYRCASSGASPIMTQGISPGQKSAASSPDSRGLERMSLDFVAPGSRPASHRAGSHGPYRYTSACYDAYGYGEEYGRPASSHSVSERSLVMRGPQGQQARPQYANAYTSTAAQCSPWTSVNAAHGQHRPSTAGSSNWSDGELIDSSDPESPSSYHRKTSPNGISTTTQTDPPRREPRLAYGEEERAFIMVCAVLRGMTWKEIEKEFRERFPAGQKRRHPETGLWPTYPEQERTAGGLTCAYYRIREQWGITKVRGVSDEQKPEVKAVVKRMIMSKNEFPDLQAVVQECR